MKVYVQDSEPMSKIPVPDALQKIFICGQADFQAN
jgi:hypothetical protein